MALLRIWRRIPSVSRIPDSPGDHGSEVYPMSRMPLLLLISAIILRAAGFTADSARGELLFQSLSCIQCHSVNGTGGSSAPDLGRIEDRGFTPASLAATMWNHAPAMWASMRARQITAGELDQQSARDLMAFFYAARFFEEPGDAGRGKRAFQSRGCAGCHGLTGAVNPKAKPVSQWQALADPLALVAAMWNHRAEMLAESGAKGARSSATQRAGFDRHTGIPAELARNPVQGGRVPHRRDARGPAGVPIGRLRQVSPNGGSASSKCSGQDADRDRGRDVESRARHGRRGSAGGSFGPGRDAGAGQFVLGREILRGCRTPEGGCARLCQRKTVACATRTRPVERPSCPSRGENSAAPPCSRCYGSTARPCSIK